MDAGPVPARVVSLPLLLVADDGTEAEVRITLDWPRPDDDDPGCWSCPLDLAGLVDRPRPIYGGDGLQALVLALRLAEVELILAARRRRGRWLDPDTREPINLAGYFGRDVVAAAR